MALRLPLTSLLLISCYCHLLSPATPTPTQPQPQPHPHPHPQPQTLTPTPATWPEQFHSVLFINYSNDLSLVDLWYDWPGGRNFNIITHQRGGGARLFDLEWDNGTSFYYTLEEPRSCRTAHFDVGVLRPDWLRDAKYLGRDRVDGFDCHVWTKADFITYYQDVDTERPVKWIFYTGRTVHVMTYEVGAVLEDAAWQAPVYCFQKNDTTTEQQEIKNPDMFSFDNACSINHNRIRQKELTVRSSSDS